MAKKPNLDKLLGARNLASGALKEAIDANMSPKKENNSGQVTEPTKQPHKAEPIISEGKTETGENTGIKEVKTGESTYSEERQSVEIIPKQKSRSEPEPEIEQTPVQSSEKIQGKKKKSVDSQAKKRISPQQVSLDDDVHKFLKLAGVLTGKDMRTLVREAIEKHPDYQKAKKSFS